MEIVAEHLGFPEGPAWSERDLCLYFVDWHGNRVLAWDGVRVEQIFTPQPGSGPSGLGISPQGYFWLCLYDTHKLALYSRKGEILYEISSFQGKSFLGVCDLAVDSMGGVYFTDSGDFEEDWRSGRPAGSVYYLDPSGKLACVDTSLCFPNGIAVTPEGKRLFVNEHRLNRTLVYERLGDSFGLRHVFFEYDTHNLLHPESAYELGPDGACLDGEGCLWTAHYGGGKIVQVSPEGRLLQSFRLPRGRLPTNLAFSASQRRLYVTEAEFGLLYQMFHKKSPG
jgi:gluconolactonase